MENKYFFVVGYKSQGAHLRLTSEKRLGGPGSINFETVILKTSTIYSSISPSQKRYGIVFFLSII